MEERNGPGTSRNGAHDRRSAILTPQEARCERDPRHHAVAPVAAEVAGNDRVRFAGQAAQVLRRLRRACRGREPAEREGQAVADAIERRAVDADRKRDARARDRALIEGQARRQAADAP